WCSSRVSEFGGINRAARRVPNMQDQHLISDNPVEDHIWKVEDRQPAMLELIDGPPDFRKCLRCFDARFDRSQHLQRAGRTSIVQIGVDFYQVGQRARRKNGIHRPRERQNDLSVSGATRSPRAISASASAMAAASSGVSDSGLLPASASM